MRAIRLTVMLTILVAGCGTSREESLAIDRDRAIAIGKKLAAFSDVDLAEYAEPECELDPKRDDWRLTFSKKANDSSKFAVVVNGENGEAILIPGE